MVRADDQVESVRLLSLFDWMAVSGRTTAPTEQSTELTWMSTNVSSRVESPSRTFPR